MKSSINQHSTLCNGGHDKQVILTFSNSRSSENPENQDQFRDLNPADVDEMVPCCPCSPSSVLTSTQTTRLPPDQSTNFQGGWRGVLMLCVFLQKQEEPEVECCVVGMSSRSVYRSDNEFQQFAWLNVGFLCGSAAWLRRGAS